MCGLQSQDHFYSEHKPSLSQNISSICRVPRTKESLFQKPLSKSPPSLDTRGRHLANPLAFSRMSRGLGHVTTCEYKQDGGGQIKADQREFPAGGNARESGTVRIGGRGRRSWFAVERRFLGGWCWTVRGRDRWQLCKGSRGSPEELFHVLRPSSLPSPPSSKEVADLPGKAWEVKG